MLNCDRENQLSVILSSWKHATLHWFLLPHFNALNYEVIMICLCVRSVCGLRICVTVIEHGYGSTLIELFTIYFYLIEINLGSPDTCRRWCFYYFAAFLHCYELFSFVPLGQRSSVREMWHRYDYDSVNYYLLLFPSRCRRIFLSHFRFEVVW